MSLTVGCVFISYRRSDSSSAAHRLYDELIRSYGRSAITFDVYTIPPGVGFREYIQESIARCDVLLAIIGNNWEDPQDGISRLQSTEDFVRIEIEEALKRDDQIKIVPILVSGRRVLQAADLPAEMKAITDKNYFFLSDGINFREQLNNLVREIDFAIFKSASVAAAVKFIRFVVTKRWQMLFIVTALSFVVSAAAVTMYPPIFLILRGVSVKDAEVFRNRADGQYEVARGVAGRSALDNETNIVETILGTQSTFDFFAERGAFINQWQDSLREIVRRGARIRIILLDNSTPDMRNIKNKRALSIPGQVHHSADYYNEESRKVWRDIQNLEYQFMHMPKSSTGSFEFRVIDNVYQNSIWVRDGGSQRNAVGHIQVSFYGDDRLYPIIRFGRLSNEMIQLLQGEFDFLWGMSYKPPSVQ